MGSKDTPTINPWPCAQCCSWGLWFCTRHTTDFRELQSTAFLFLKFATTNILSCFPNLSALDGLCQPFLLFCDVIYQVSLNFVKNGVYSSVSPSFQGRSCVLGPPLQKYCARWPSFCKFIMLLNSLLCFFFVSTMIVSCLYSMSVNWFSIMYTFAVFHLFIHYRNIMFKVSICFFSSTIFLYHFMICFEF